MNDLLQFGDSPPMKEKTGLSLSAVKSLVLREKEEKLCSKLSVDDEVHSFICSLFESEEYTPQRKNICSSGVHSRSSLLKDFHGAPPESFVYQISNAIGGLNSLHKAASFWRCIVLELRKLWCKGRPIPRMPLDADPDLNSCLLHQQLQVINCCIARKKRRAIAKEELDSVLKQKSLDSSHSGDSPQKCSLHNKFYAKNSVGDYVLRLGADCPSQNLTMLETGEPIYSPVLQEGPVLTEELIKETEEFVLRTGSVGAGCSQLLSDMQAFKAANPGCVLEDFVRWHSPPDWTEDGLADNSFDGDGSSKHGRLSERMRKKGNLWRELWETAKALPAVEQTPLFDEDLSVESIFTTLEDIQPSKLFEQLLNTMLSVGFLVGERMVPADSNLSKLFHECKEYIISIYQGGLSKEKLDDICKVYETIEAIIVHPEDAIMITEQPDETSVETKGRFKRINLNFIGKDKQPFWKRAPKDEKKSDEKHMHLFSHLLDKKVSIFSKKNPKLDGSSSSAVTTLDENEWTIV
ncbi:uncharacterized protein [Typha angustifolia]